MPVSIGCVESRPHGPPVQGKVFSPLASEGPGASEFHAAHGSCSGIDVIDECIGYIEKHLTRKITLDDLARFCGRNKFQIIRTFRKSLGTTPHAFILGVRVSRAAELLRRGEPAAEVACEVGFVDQSHLIRYFKRHVGMTPRRFVYQA